MIIFLDVVSLSNHNGIRFTFESRISNIRKMINFIFDMLKYYRRISCMHHKYIQGVPKTHSHKVIEIIFIDFKIKNVFYELDC